VLTEALKHWVLHWHVSSSIESWGRETTRAKDGEDAREHGLPSMEEKCQIIFQKKLSRTSSIRPPEPRKKTLSLSIILVD